MLPVVFSDETDGDQRPLIEALVQALNSFVDRLKQSEARIECDAGQKPKENPYS